jgi:hypothetical protein
VGFQTLTTAVRGPRPENPGLELGANREPRTVNRGLRAADSTDVNHVTASATYHHQSRPGRPWASTIAWGLNSEEGEASHALLAESTLTLDERDTWFGRFEIAGKSAHDLDVHGSDEIFTVAKLQAATCAI